MKDIDDIFNSQDGTDAPALTSLTKQMKDTALEAQKVRAELEKIGSQKVETEKYKEQQQILQEFEAELSKLKAQETEISSIFSGGYKPPVYDEVLQQIHEYEQGIAEIKAELENMRKNGTAFVDNKSSAQYTEMERKLDSINDKLKVQLVKHQQIIQKQAKQNENYKETDTHLKRAKKSTDLLGMSFKKILKYGFGIRSVFVLINRIRRALVEGFKNLSDFSEPLKKQIDSLKGSFSQLKNSFASAFAPIVQMAIPYIQKLVDWLNILFDKMAQFGSAIAGQKAYAKAIKQTGDAAAEAGSKAQSGLANFDKLNNLSSQGSGGGQKMFEEAVVSSEALAAADKLKKTVSQILSPIKKAWKENNVGLRIIEKIQSIFSTIREHIKDIISSTLDWWSNLDFVPILESVDKLLGGIEKVATPVLDIFKDLWNSVLLPLAGWAIEESIPVVLDLVAAAFNLLGTALSFIEPFISPIIDGFFVPIFGFAWDVLETALTTVTSLIQGIADVLSGDKSFAQFIEELGPLEAIILAVATAIGAVSVALGIMNAIGAISAGVMTAVSVAGGVLTGVLGVITSPITLIIAAIAALVAAGIALYKNWDKVAATMKKIFNGLWNVIKNVINAILSGVEGLANGVINGLNFVIKALNKLSFDVPDWVPILGGKKFGFNIPEIKQVNIPRLATGQVVPPNVSEYLAILGDNNKETEVVSPLSTIRQAVTEAMQGMGGGVGQQTIVLNLDGREFMRVLVDRNNDYKKQNGGVSAFA